MSFLDKQSMLFIETADMLARTSREALIAARLPNYHITAAVEVLTTGNYGRLPICIKDRLLPIKALTNYDQKHTLRRLNQAILHRLVTDKLIPQMRDFKVYNIFNILYTFSTYMPTALARLIRALLP